MYPTPQINNNNKRYPFPFICHPFLEQIRYIGFMLLLLLLLLLYSLFFKNKTKSETIYVHLIKFSSLPLLFLFTYSSSSPLSPPPPSYIFFSLFVPHIYNPPSPPYRHTPSQQQLHLYLLFNFLKTTIISKQTKEKASQTTPFCTDIFKTKINFFLLHILFLLYYVTVFFSFNKRKTAYCYSLMFMIAIFFLVVLILHYHLSHHLW
eukprot:UN01385